MTEPEALRAAVAAAWDAYYALVGRETCHAGSGRDGHLTVDDLEPLRLALLKARSFTLPAVKLSPVAAVMAGTDES